MLATFAAPSKIPAVPGQHNFDFPQHIPRWQIIWRDTGKEKLGAKTMLFSGFSVNSLAHTALCRINYFHTSLPVMWFGAN